MKPFDFNIHLPSDGRNLIKNELGSSVLSLSRFFLEHYKNIGKNVCSGNFMLFNQRVLADKKAIDFTRMVCNCLPGAYFTLLADFRAKDTVKLIADLKNGPIKGVKFHSYVQRITRSDYPRVLKICRIAQKQNKYICIDTSFGTSKMYEYDNLKLACFICDHITRTPIILLHSGGARVREAMLLAQDKKNVYLETSFSLNYFSGSILTADFAFAFKKIGSKRVIYGSDFPYVSFRDSLGSTMELLKKYKFSSSEIYDIMRGNAMKLGEAC